MRGNNAHAVSGRVSHMKSVYLDGDEGSESQTQRKSEASVIIQKIVRGRSSRIKHLKLAPKLTGAEHDGDVNVTVLPAAGRYAGVLKPVISCSACERAARAGAFSPATSAPSSWTPKTGGCQFPAVTATMLSTPKSTRSCTVTPTSISSTRRRTTFR